MQRIAAICRLYDAQFTSLNWRSIPNIDFDLTKPLPRHRHVFQFIMHFLCLISHSLLALLVTLSAAASPIAGSQNSSNEQRVYCFNSEQWRGPSWNPTVLRAFTNILTRIHDRYVEPAPTAEFEFLDERQTPATKLPLVYTPFKITLGMPVQPA